MKKDLYHNISSALKTEGGWIPKWKIQQMVFKNRNGTTAMIDTVMRTLRDMECGHKRDANKTPLPQNLRVAVKPFGKSHAYHYLPPNLIYKYITWVEREDKYVIWRTGAVKPREYKQVGEIVGNVYRLRTVEV